MGLNVLEFDFKSARAIPFSSMHLYSVLAIKCIDHHIHILKFNYNACFIGFFFSIPRSYLSSLETLLTVSGATTSCTLLSRGQWERLTVMSS